MSIIRSVLSCLFLLQATLGCSDSDILLECVSPNGEHVAVYISKWDTVSFGRAIGADSTLTGRVYVRRTDDPKLQTPEALKIQPISPVEFSWSSAEELAVRYPSDATAHLGPRYVDGVGILPSALESSWEGGSRCAE